MSRDGNKGKDEVGEHERREEVKGGQYLLGLEQGSRGQGERDGQGKDQDKKSKKKKEKDNKKKSTAEKKTPGQRGRETRNPRVQQANF